MKLVALIRTKNSVVVLRQALEKLSELVDEIIAMDNGSTDGCIDVFKDFPKIVKVMLRNDDGDFNEGRDMNMLLEQAKKRNADFITMAWPDEVFEKNMTREVMEKYMNSGYDRISFRLSHYWLSLTHCRYDRDWFRYSLLPQREIWRNMDGMYFKDVFIHPGLVQGITTKKYISPYRIKHYGYAFEKDMDKKAAIYREIDPDSGKYDSIGTKITGIKYYKFIEFKNKYTNYLYISLFNMFCKTLLVILNFKRKYFSKIKVFSDTEPKA